MKKPRFEEVLGHALYLARVDKRISQEKLAEMADIERTTLSDVERGDGRPSVYFYVRVANALGFNPGEMLDQTIAEFLAGGGKFSAISGRMRAQKTITGRSAKVSSTRVPASARKSKK
jgi:transcriptional regulator with XRE-family HTH domain